MNWIPVVTIAIGGLVLALPVWLILEIQSRAIVFLIRSVSSSSWRERPLSPWKIMDLINPCRDAAFFNSPPQVTRNQSLAIGAVSAIIAYCCVWQLYFHLPG